ncbi:MAG TPA: hypothetical protein VFN61_16295, partial [Acidimicrobiales bacterium]|nr:hypothetical protein [Acidimicrobiales bacterium]
KPVAPKSVSVVDIAGSYDAAVSAGQALASQGLPVSSETVGAEPSSTTATWVLYHSLPDQARALYVMKYISGSVMMQLDPTVPAGTVQVELGSVASVAARATVSTTTATTSAPASTGTTASSTSSTSTTSAVSRSSATRATAGSQAATTTTVPTPAGAPVSSSQDQVQPWDPRACAAS